MNVSRVVNAYDSYYSQKDRTSREGIGFAGIMERLSARRAAEAEAASADAAERAAAVRAGLDSQTLKHLDKYAEIYNKYAAEYGDGFELKGSLFICGDPESEAEARLYNEIKTAFQNELYEAGIPGEYRFEPVGEFEWGGELNGFAVARGYMGEKNTGIDALFYAEKYGLAGLSAEGKIKSVLGGMETSSANEMREAAEKLYLAGAICGKDMIDLTTRTTGYASSAQGGSLSAALNAPIDWSGLLDILGDDESGESLLDMLIKAWQSQDKDDEGAKLEALMKKIDEMQLARHEELEQRIEKLRERELLGKARAESARLRVFLGLDGMADTDTAAVDPL